MQELNSYLESVEAGYQRLQNAAEEFWYHAIDSDAVKNILEISTGLIHIADTLVQIGGVMPIITGAIGALMMYKADTSIVDFFLNASNGASNFKETAANAFDTVKKAVSDFTKAAKRNFTEFSGAAKDAAKSTEVVTKGADGASKSVEGLSKAAQLGQTAMTAFKGVLTSVAIWAVATAVSKLGEGVSYLAETQKRVTKKFAEANEELKNTESTISEYKTEIEGLIEVRDDESSSLEESKNARLRLMEIQSELIDTLGNEAETIDLIRQAADGSTEALDRLVEKQRELAKSKLISETGIGDSIANFFGGYENNYDRLMQQYERGYVGSNTIHAQTSFTGKEQELLEYLFKEGFTFGAGAGELKFDFGNADQTLDKLLKVQAALEDFENVPTAFANGLAERISEIQELLNSGIGDFYESDALEKINSSDTYKKYYDDAQKYYEQYEDAVADGDAKRQEELGAKITQSIRGGIDEAAANGADDVLYVFESLFENQIPDIIAEQSFKLDIEANTDGVKDKLDAIFGAGGVLEGATDEDVLAFDSAPASLSDSLEIQEAREQLNLLKKEYEMTTDQMIAMLIQVGHVQDSNVKALQEKYGEANIDKLGSDINYALSLDTSTIDTYEELVNEIELIKAKAEAIDVSDLVKKAAQGLSGDDHAIDDETKADLHAKTGVDFDSLGGSISQTKKLIEIQDEAIASHADLYEALSKSPNENWLDEFNSRQLTDITTQVELLVSMADQLAEASSMIGDGFVVAADDVATLTQVFPELLVNAQTFADGSIQLDQEWVNSFLDGETSMLEADTDTYRTMLENKIAMLDAEIAYHNDNIELLEQAEAKNIDKAQLEEGLTANVAEYQGAVTEELAGMNDDASQSAMDNIAEVVNVSTENLDILGEAVENVDKAFAAIGTGTVSYKATGKTAKSGTISGFSTSHDPSRDNLGNDNAYFDNIRNQLAKEKDAMAAAIKQRAAYQKALSNLNSGGKSAATSTNTGRGSSNETDPYIEKYEEEKAALQRLRDNNMISEKEYLERLRVLYIKYYADKEKYLKEYQDEEREYLQDMKSYYDDMFSYIINLYSKRMDAIQEESDAATAALEKQKSDAEAAYQAQIDAVEAQIDALENQKKQYDDQIEALEKEKDAIADANAERQRQIDLQKAQYELERAQNQKSQLVYSTDKGYVYQTDDSAIKDARENVRSAEDEIAQAEIDKQIDQLQELSDTIDDTIDGLNDQIDALNDMIDKSNDYYDGLIESTEAYYQSIIDGMQAQSDRFQELLDLQETAEMNARLASLGIIDSEENILEMSDAKFQQIKATYLGVLKSLNEGNDSIIAQISELSGYDLSSMQGYISDTAAAFSELSGVDLTTAVNSVGQLETSLMTIQEAAARVAGAIAGGSSATLGLVEGVSGATDEEGGAGAAQQGETTSMAGSISKAFEEAGTAATESSQTVVTAFESVTDANDEMQTQLQEGFVVSTENINAATDATNSLIAALDAIPRDIEVNVHINTTGSTDLGSVGLGGYANFKGTVGKAFASGYNGLKHSEKNALRSEFGQPELTVYPDGTYELTNQPVISDLPKDTVIFNEDQTEKILSGTGAPGKAFRGGTITELDAGSPLLSVLNSNMAKSVNPFDTFGTHINKLVKAISDLGKNSGVKQTIKQEFHVSLPNVNDSTAATALLRDLQLLGTKKLQAF